MKIKFTIIDYLIIILVVCAIAFAFIHITTDDSSELQKTAFDESTVNKIPDTYTKYYKDGYIVNASLDGFNSTNGERVNLNGTVIWEDDNGGGNVRLLIKSGNETYLAGLYRYTPDADIYINHISLESNGEKYNNLTEIVVKPKEITSLNDLISGIGNDTDYEITTTLSLNSLDSKNIQKAINKLTENGDRISIKTSNSERDSQIIISEATKQNINNASSILGNIDGISNEIHIRIYNSDDNQIENIKNNYDVINIRKF